MKLPKREDKFVITEKTSPCYGNVVSGIHLDVRGDDYGQLWYYVRVDHAYEGNVISCYGGYVYAARTLKDAFDYVAKCLTPYLEPEEKVENGLDAREGTSDGQRRPDSVSGVFEETGVLDTVDHDCGKFFSCRHNLTYAVESGLDAADRLGGVSLA